MATADELALEPPCKPLMAAVPSRDGMQPAAPQYRLIPAGGILYAQGETCEDIFTVIEGWVFLHHILEDGRRQVLDFLLPGDFCGGLAASEDGASHTAEALTEVTVAVLPRSRLPAMFASNPGYGEAFMTRMVGALLCAYDALTDAGRRTAIEAVAHLLLRLDARIRATEDDPRRAEIDFPLTQEHIGDALGLTAVHVCRTLRVLREQGIATLSRMRLRIEDRQHLMEIAGAESASSPATRAPAARAEAGR